MRTSIIIPTYNRPQELDDCIRSLLVQTVLPWEIIIIDDGNLPDFPRRAECEANGIQCVFRRKGTPGLVASRNLGAEIARGEVVFYLDDDVVLEPQYIEEILLCYKRPEKPIGVGGIIANEKPLGFSQRVQYYLLLLFGATGLREGRVMPSGFCVDYAKTPFPITQVRRVEFLPGGVCSYRREVFDTLRFSDAFKSASGYSQGEDKDFSYRVSRLGPLLVTPKARLDHFEAPKTNYDKYAKGRAIALSRYYFFKDSVMRRPWQWLCFWYALSGYVFVRAGVAAVSRGKGETGRVRGLLSAVKDIVTRKIPDHL